MTDVAVLIRAFAPVMWPVGFVVIAVVVAGALYVAGVTPCPIAVARVFAEPYFTFWVTGCVAFMGLPVAPIFFG